MALIDLQVKQATPRERDWKLADGGGLYILVRPNGAKLWRMKYRQHGKEKELAFGRYPEVGLKEARLLRDEARVGIGRGGDPARRKREEKIAAFIRAGDTFESVAHEYIAKREAEGLAMATLVKSNWLASVLSKSIGELSTVLTESSGPLREATLASPLVMFDLRGGNLERFDEHLKEHKGIPHPEVAAELSSLIWGDFGVTNAASRCIAALHPQRQVHQPDLRWDHCRDWLRPGARSVDKSS